MSIRNLTVVAVFLAVVFIILVAIGMAGYEPDSNASTPAHHAATPSPNAVALPSKVQRTVDRVLAIRQMTDCDQLYTISLDALDESTRRDDAGKRHDVQDKYFNAAMQRLHSIGCADA